MPNVVIANRIVELKSLYNALVNHYFSHRMNEDIKPFKVLEEGTDFKVDLSYGSLKYSITNPEGKEIKYEGFILEYVSSSKEIGNKVSELVAAASGDDGFNELLMSYVEKNFHEVYINPHTNRSYKGYYLPNIYDIHESLYFLNTANVPRTIPKYLNTEGFKGKLETLNQGLHSLAGLVFDEVKKSQVSDSMYLKDKFRRIDGLRNSPSRFEVVNYKSYISYENNTFTYGGIEGKIILKANYSDIAESSVEFRFGMLSCKVTVKTLDAYTLDSTITGSRTLNKTFENSVFSEKLVSLAKQTIEAFEAVYSNFTPNVVDDKDLWENYPNYIDFSSYNEENGLVYKVECEDADLYGSLYDSKGVSLYNPMDMQRYRPNCLVGFGGKNLKIESI